jgi:hypothetical protein
MIYSKINEFCKVRNVGNCYANGSEPTPRVKFIMELLDKEGIEYELDSWEYTRPSRFNYRNKISFQDPYLKNVFGDEEVEEEEEQPKNMMFNIIMKGSSDKMIIAHHDVNNHTIDNANDNSCSVINVIATKKLRPDVHAVLVDGEEFGGHGSKRLGQQIKQGNFGNISWVLNFELTGKGGKYFFIGDYPGKLSDKITGLFDCPIVRTPFNDSVTLRELGIDSVVINPAPPMPEGKKSDLKFPRSGKEGIYLDFSVVFCCHRPTDTLSSIDVNDMKEFVETVVLKILQ